MNPKKTRKTFELAKPAFDIDENGAKVYVGSLGATRTELNDEQELAIKRELKKRVCLPTDLVDALPGLNQFDPHCAEGIRRYLAKQELKGTVVQVKTDAGRLIGWKAAEKEI